MCRGANTRSTRRSVLSISLSGFASAVKPQSLHILIYVDSYGAEIKERYAKNIDKALDMMKKACGESECSLT